jgi:membrane-associated phospholipid phosphatase
MIALIVFTVYALLIFSFKGDPVRPFSAAAVFVRELWSSRKLLIHFSAMVSVLVFNKVEIALENGNQYGSDFTPFFYKLEGEFAVGLQRLFENDVLTFGLGYFYLVVFPALMIVSIGLYTYEKRYKLFNAVCYAMMINYMIAIPFYFFFRVNEVHAFNPNVKFLLLDMFPSFESEYRPLSDVDNCFPSLHTSLSVSMAVIAARSGNRFWKTFTRISTAVIMFSTIYLGIHWLTDMIAGLTLGYAASRLALRLSEGRQLFGGMEMERRNVDGKW